MVTTYLTDNASEDAFSAYINGTEDAEEINMISEGKFIVGGDCTCEIEVTKFVWSDIPGTVKVYSTAVTIPVSVDVNKCDMPFHKIGAVTWKIDSVEVDGEMVDDTSVYATTDDDTVTLKPQARDYTVVLKATLEDWESPLDEDTWEISVTMDSSKKSIDIGNGPVTVTAASEEGKVTYTQDGNGLFTVDEDEQVVIFGEYTCSENDVNVIKITDCSPTIVLEGVTISTEYAKNTHQQILSNILIEDTNPDDDTTYETTLLLSGGNTLIRGVGGQRLMRNSTTGVLQLLRLCLKLKMTVMAAVMQ